MYAGIIGSISAMMLNMDASGSRYLSRLDEMTQYMVSAALAVSFEWRLTGGGHQRDNNLPTGLRARVREYFEQRWRQRKMFSEDELLTLLPTSMEKVRHAFHPLRRYSLTGAHDTSSGDSHVQLRFRAKQGPSVARSRPRFPVSYCDVAAQNAAPAFRGASAAAGSTICLVFHQQRR